MILFSSDIREPEMQKALEMGAEIYLEKPHGFTELKDAVARIWNWGIARGLAC